LPPAPGDGAQGRNRDDSGLKTGNRGASTPLALPARPKRHTRMDAGGKRAIFMRLHWHYI